MRAWLGSARLAAAGPVFAASIVLFSSAERAGAEVWRINDVDQSVSIHLRKNPSNRSKVVAYIPVDADGLKGGKCEDEWCPIEYKGIKGWVFRKYLMPDEAAKTAETVAALPKPDVKAPQPATPELGKVLQLTQRSGPPTPVYAFPNEKLPIAGHLAAETRSVELAGPCVQNWCYIKSDKLIGWLQDSNFAKAEAAQAPAKVETAAQIAAPVKADTASETRALSKNETTATQTAAVSEAAVAGTSAESGNKLYSLAGLSSDTALPIRERPEDTAPIVAFIPSEAKDIEGLHKCSGRWCLVRQGGATGWVQRRHLADESGDAGEPFQVSGVALWSALDVVDHPSANATVVGQIPAYATGIVPIGGCDKTWCHVRYLGIAGWVNGQYLAPLAR